MTHGKEPELLVVIPARFASVRFPGKPLADICGKPMIQWVYESARQCTRVARVIVATDSEKIQDACRLFGAETMLTGTHHQTGTDRIGEVAEKVGDFDVYVNVQGDQPFVKPADIDKLVEPFFGDRPPSMATVGCPLNENSIQDPNAVKVICDQQMDAIYFSRSAIPYRREKVGNLPVYQHLGLYAFSRDFLFQFRDFAPTPLEQSEQLEQLRAVENGTRIRVSLVEQPTIEVNTPEDLVAANAAMAELAGN